MNRFIIAILLLVITVSADLKIARAQTNTGNAETNRTREQALQLINLPEPTFKPFVTEKIELVKLPETEIRRIYDSKPRRFKMKDGKYLSADFFVKKKSRLTIVLLHGVLSNALKMNKAAGLLRDAARAEVFALDLRGHGRSDGAPGDVDYIDQYAEDVAGVIAQIKKDKPNNKIIVAGHSMGGGIGLRFAMLKNRALIDGFLLFAPLLGQNTPTFPPPGKVQTDKEPFLKIHIQRLIGLKMMNSIGEHQYDGLKVLFFNVPQNAPIKAYTYRANESMAPVDYAEGLKSVREPLLVLVGSRDEAFTASAFENAVKSNSQGEVFVIEGATHNGITEHPESMRLIGNRLTTKIGKASAR